MKLFTLNKAGTRIIEFKKRPTQAQKQTWFIQGFVFVMGLSYFLLVVTHAHAMQFPSDTVTLATTTSAVVYDQQLFPSSSQQRTILSSSYVCNGTFPSYLYLGSYNAAPASTILSTLNGLYTQTNNQPIVWNAGSAVQVHKDIFATCSYWLSYVPRNIATTPDPQAILTTAYSTSTATSSAQIVVGGFTYGEVFQIFLLLLIFSLLFFSEVRNVIFKNGVVVRVIKEYDRKK